ncbi:MAG: UDP-N-acetylmuramate--L-alanine ligase [Bacteroides sp.]|nr:UDP-N-acetylmuramate--L-alanine ligase [Eubacterium sp.]MCM1418823.1 UDP-N-acetylmuramate--L-alanine ligase [Roseburia sp.]MCM1462097.1 UDP-N-acetylmuramate--L-alanine ligase [Bacteroides sp.]
MENFLIGKKHIHFIGIGGSGMYPLAQILHEQGYHLTGSDNNETETLAAVRKMGITVYLGQRAENIEGADLIVHTAAIMEDNPELIAARKSGVPVVERSILLGLVTIWYKNAVCVCGTHGKTTTSAMLTHIFLAEGIDLTAVIGGKLRAIHGSGISGKSDVMVCEACEFVDTFLKLSPNTSVVLNIDRDHLDYFKTMENLRASFTKFCDLTTDRIVYNGDDENTRLALAASRFAGERITFGRGAGNDYSPAAIERLGDFHTRFTLLHRGEPVETLDLYVPGDHNVLNATAACAAALSLGCRTASLKEGLSSFRGAVRRFEKLAELGGITIADDYAHHPTEVKTLLETAKAMNFKRVWAVHQPFTYSRTATLLDEFAEALRLADRVVLSEIMGGREKNTYNIYAKDLAEKIDGAVWFPTFDEIADYVCANAREGDLILTFGCGDVYKAAYLMIEKMGGTVEHFE